MLIGCYLSPREKTLKRRRRWQWAWRKASWTSSLNRYAFRIYMYSLVPGIKKMRESSDLLEFSDPHTHARTHAEVVWFIVWLEGSDRCACFHMHWSLKSHPGFPFGEDSSASHSGFKEICGGISERKISLEPISFPIQVYSEAESHQWSELLI